MQPSEIMDIRKRYLAHSYSADIYDVMDKMGYPHQCLDLAIAPLRDDYKVCGPAVTVLGTREPLDNEELLEREGKDRWWQFHHMYEGCVVVINAEGERNTGHWGEMMSYGARQKGAVGVVIDGGTRDKTGILGIDDWTCFARYTSPIESAKRWRPKAMEVPIFMSGALTSVVRVEPGDWIFGDNDAVLVIPKEVLLEVLAKVEELSDLEVKSRQAFAEGKSIEEVYELFKRA